MTMRKKAFEFDEDQRRELTALGVVPSQLEALEEAMPRVGSMLQRPPRLDDVRGKLRKLGAALSSAAKHLKNLDHLGDENSAGADARDRIERFSRKKMGADAPLNTQLAIEELSFYVQKALDRLAKEEATRDEAQWGPVRLIDEALRHGWDNASDYPHTPVTTLSSMGSKFAGVVIVCYDAVLRPNVKGKERARAIREYVAWLRQLPAD